MSAIGHHLRDGTEVTVRSIDPTDADALVRFHEALSPESQRLRFFGVHPHLSAKELQRFTTVDHRDREALVVVTDGEISGVARYDRLPNTDDAEIAFVTRDDVQGRGIATLLFRALATAGAAAGITRFIAETLLENRKMLAVFAATGLVSNHSFDHGVVELTMPLPANGATS
jgi:RimJ/RimL family protein N-acetyltransferase